MAQLCQDYDLFAQRNTEILILGPDGPQAYKRHWEQEKMPAVGLADVKSRVADLYYQEVNLIKLGRMPAQFIVDPQGTVRYAYYGRSMSDIPSNASMLEMLDYLQKPDPAV
jgi:peroxiredoxin Q/BCP